MKNHFSVSNPGGLRARTELLSSWPMSYSITFSSIASWMISHRHLALICRINKMWYLFNPLSISLAMASISGQDLISLYTISFLRESTSSTLWRLRKPSPDPIQIESLTFRSETLSMASPIPQATSIATSSSTRIRPWTSQLSPWLEIQSSLWSSLTSLNSPYPLMPPHMIGARA